MAADSGKKAIEKSVSFSISMMKMQNIKIVDREFRGSLSKIRRAKQHINHIFSLEQSYFSAKPYIFFEELDENGLQLFKVKILADAPEELEGAVSDSIIGLRSSLDLAVAACARLDGADKIETIYFPFAKSYMDWETRAIGRIKGLRDSVIQQIRKFQPWGGGNNALYGLHLS